MKFRLSYDLAEPFKVCLTVCALLLIWTVGGLQFSLAPADVNDILALPAVSCTIYKKKV